MKAKDTLEEIMNAFCMCSENIQKVYNLSGIKAQLYNGKRTREQLIKLLLRAINEEKAKEIVNKIPFPFIAEYHGTEYMKEFIDNTIITKRECGFWETNVLAPLKIKRGYRMENVTQDYATQYR
jgi:hypothetical protein